MYVRMYVCMYVSKNTMDSGLPQVGIGEWAAALA